MPGLLSGLRVLDLSDQKGVYCCKILADLGADVIRIEPPGGDPMRRIGPFFNGEPHPEKSLYWFHMNTNKKSITLNLNNDDGKELVKKLVATADVMVETFPPGHLREMGLDYENLGKINGSLILTSISPFGQNGPWSQYKSSDIVALALGGQMSLCGWPDGPPERIAGSLAYHQCSLQAAVATMIAVYNRLVTGHGIHIDVSMHECMPITMMVSVPRYIALGEIRGRDGNEHAQPAYGIFQCKDGYVDLRLFNADWENLVAWLESEGMAADLKEEKWKDGFFRWQKEAREHIDSVVQAFLSTHTKKEIYEEGQKRKLQVGAGNDAKDVSQDPQLLAREYFVNVEHPELGTTMKYLGAPFRLSEIPWRIRKRAPLIGEHNSEIYGQELGLSGDEIVSLKKGGII